MSSAPIKVEGLGKMYTIGHERRTGAHATLRDTVAHEVKGLLKAASNMLHGRPLVQGDELEEVWALRDVTFEVKKGEVVGLIGRNGAGKSTLLKVLSRITEPTQGRATIRGRVASLLEVGTGFHPELSGRENIFLNGAILGMTRAEVRRKFDEIVAFSDVGRYLDTPVKRYSSGMHVRLAFAVAAHLEPEILIVDEVLAVGDAEFQRKCLGKMRSVAANEGRTVLFVSHNMPAVRGLCNRAIQLEGGRIAFEGDAASSISHYLSQSTSTVGERRWPASEAPGNETLRLHAARVSAQGEVRGTFGSSERLVVELEFEAHTNNPGLCVGFDLHDAQGAIAFRTYQTDMPHDHWLPVRAGINRWRCAIPAGTLNGGTYSICPRISIHNVEWLVHLDSVVQFEVDLDHGKSPLWTASGPRNRPGVTAPILEWSIADEDR